MKFIYLLIIIALIGLVNADLVKNVNNNDKTITISDNYNDLVKLKLLYNTYHCSECEAVIQIDNYNGGDLFNDIIFNNLDSKKNQLIDYNIQIVGDTNKVKYDKTSINTKIKNKGTYIIRISGKKDNFANIDWIVNILGLNLSEWEKWGITNIYDEINTSSIDFLKWSITENSSNGGGYFCNFFEDNVTMNVSCVKGGLVGGCSGSISSIRMPNYADLENVSMKVYQVATYSTGARCAKTKLTIFGQIVTDYNACLNGIPYDDTSIFDIRRNLTNFDVYDDGTKISQITPLNNDVYIYAFSTGNDASGQTGSISLGYVYYSIGNSSMTLNITSPNDYISILKSTPVTISITSNVSLNSLYNITFFMNNQVNETRSITGTRNVTTFNKYFPLGANTYYFQVCDNDTNCKFSTIGRVNTTEHSLNSVNYNPITYSGSPETFNINITYDNVYYSAMNTILSYNNTNYTSDSIVYDGYNYIISKSLNVPTVSNSSNVSFYWLVGLTNSSGTTYFNTTVYNQTVNPFSVSTLNNCTAGSILLINYTLYDEQTKNLIPDSNGISIDTSINIYDLTYNNLIFNYSSHSVTNNTKLCISNFTNASYYIDAQTQYYAGGYVAKFNNIQKYLVNNNTIPINIPLYDLNTSYSQEFTVNFKDSNFAPKSNVLVDVSRKYIDEGIFRSVEVAKTDSDGQTIIHLQLSNVIYTLTFKNNGQILAVLDNVLAKCTALPCVINVNAYSSTTNVNDFNYVNGVYVKQGFDQNSKTITVNFISNSGTKTITFNVTKYDLLNNNTVCTSSITSSSGTLNCVIPNTFGNTTFVSEVYADNELIDQKIINIPNPNPDDSGSYIILAIMIIITLSMLFISDVRGILIGGFLGFILSGLLLFINGTNLFAVGSAGTFLVIYVIILLFKINQKEAR